MKQRRCSQFRAVRILIPLLCLAMNGWAKDRMIRKYQEFDGQPSLPTNTIGQDADGFLWVGTLAGLSRFDGHRMLPWARQQYSKPVWRVHSSPSGAEVYFGGPDDILFRVTKQGIEPVQGPGGKPFQPLVDVAFTTDSTVFVALPHVIFARRAGAQTWNSIPLPEGIDPLHLGRAAGDGVLLACRKGGLWRVHFSGAIDKLRDGWIDAAVESEDGAIYYSERFLPRWPTVHLFCLRAGRAREIHAWEDQYPRFLVNGRQVWIVDTTLTAKIDRDDRLEPIPWPEGFRAETGFFDREGSLWLTFDQGLLQFPEPQVELWNGRDGLSPQGARYVKRNKEGLWISTWVGLRLLRPGSQKFEAVSVQQGQVCVDGNDVLWAGAARVGDRFLDHASRNTWLCSTSPDGTVWLSTPRMYHARAANLAPAPVPLPPGATWGSALFADSRGRVWLADNELVCWAPGAALDAGQGDAWKCTHRPGGLQVEAFAEMPSGAIWVATYQDGLWSFDTHEWKRVAGSLHLPTRFISNLVPSPRGGMWILTPGPLIRVKERLDLPDGFEVLESLSAWRTGSSTTFDIFEEPDGALWLTSSGAAYIPAEVRDRKPRRPNILLTGLAVTGRGRRLGETVEVPAGPNRIDIEFAALSYRDRSSLLYQYRLKPDLPWQDLQTNEPVLRLIDLQPGDYTISLRSSADGQNWGEILSPVKLQVLRFWYLRPPFLAAFGVALIALLAAAYHIRLRFLLGLERERNRIAMDLHDELGAGLGSIGILSGLASSDLATEPQRREISQRISTSVAELNVALGEVLWSLKGGRSGLMELMQRIVRRAETLFPGDIPKFEFRSAPVPDSAEVDFETRRNLMLVMDEALHNAARHAHARNVRLILDEIDSEWEIRLEDDGGGIHKPSNGGMGLANMKQRAAAIGAQVWMENPEAGGCRMRIRFRLAHAGKAPK